MRQRTEKTMVIQLEKSNKEALKGNITIKEMIYNAPDQIRLPEINKKFEIEGVLLKMITQKDTYKFTSQKNAKIKIDRPASMNLNKIKREMKNKYNIIPNDS